MDYFAGLDVSVKDTSICIVDDTGKIVREVKVASEPDALLHRDLGLVSTYASLPALAYA
jgi:predicted NBD/HSP70 family sugar kinase